MSTEQATPETHQPKITVHDPNEVSPKSFKFLGVKALRGKFRRTEKILSIDDPDNPDETLNFHLRALTPGEEQSLQQMMLSQEGIGDMVSKLVKKTQDGAPLETDEITGLIVEKMTEAKSNPTNDRYLRTIQMGMIAPKVSLEWLRDLNPALLELFYTTIEDLRLEQEKWIVENLIRKSENK